MSGFRMLHSWYRKRPIPLQCSSRTNQEGAGGHIESDAEKGGECLSVHKAWQWEAPGSF